MILRPTSHTVIFFSLSLMLSTSFAFPIDSSFILTQNRIVCCTFTYELTLEDDIHPDIWVRKGNLSCHALTFSGNLRFSGQPGNSHLSGHCPWSHSRAPELRGAQPLVSQEGLMGPDRKVALNPTWCLLTESFLRKLELHAWKDFVGGEWGGENKVQGEKLNRVNDEII